MGSRALVHRRRTFRGRRRGLPQYEHGAPRLARSHTSDHCQAPEADRQVRQTVEAAAPVAGLHFSRAFETEADALGVRYLSEAGYDPNASIDMFERIASTERRAPGAVAKLFLSHPPTGDRITKTQAEIRKLKPEADSYVLNTSEFEAVRTGLTAT